MPIHSFHVLLKWIPGLTWLVTRIRDARFGAKCPAVRMGAWRPPLRPHGHTGGRGLMSTWMPGMPAESPRIVLVLVCLAIQSGCAPGQAEADPASPDAAAPASAPTPAPAPAPAPAPSVDLTTVTTVRFTIVAIPDRKSWVPCGKIHSIGVLEVEVLDVGEPPPRMLLLVSCPADAGRVKLAIGETHTATLYRRKQPWPSVSPLPRDLPRRQVARFDVPRSDDSP